MADRPGEKALGSGGWRRVERILDAVLSVPEPEREQVLSRACEGEPQLRSLIVSLLAAEQEAGAFLEVGAGGYASDLLRASADPGRVQPTGGPSREEPSSFVRGSLVGGRYRISSLLGRGGMGEVYRAHDLKLDQTVALKALPSDGTERGQVERLLAEVRLAREVSHPNVCRVHDVGEAQGRSFLSMEFVDGQDLAAMLRQVGFLPWTRAVRIVLQICDGLQAAHERGVIHRDLKPANIMIDRAGRVKILDFGIALGVGRRLTTPGLVIGTTRYMSPEQARGEQLDGRTDLWSLGVVLYELLTGRSPFSIADSEARTPVSLLADPEDPADVEPSVPPQLGVGVLRLLAKDRQERFQDAKEVRQALQDLLDQETGAQAAAKRGEGLGGRRLRWLSIAAIFLVSVLLAIGLARMGGSPTPGVASDPVLEGAPEPAGIRSVVVLPLENLIGDPEQDYFVDGMTDALISHLGRISALRVVSRTSTVAYRNTHKSLSEITRELGVDAALEGAVLRAGDQVRLRVGLVAPNPERRLWGRSYTRSVLDLLAFQAELAQTIAWEIHIGMTPQEEAHLAARPATNPRAHELYLRGRSLLGQAPFEEVERGLDLLRQAVEEEPSYASAWAGIADAELMLLFRPDARAEKGYHEARVAAHRALAIDNANVEALLALTRINLEHEWRWDEARENVTRALAINPSSSEAHRRYSWLQVLQGRPEGAVAAMERAKSLDPVSPLILTDWVKILYLAERYPEAVAAARDLLQMSPKRPSTHRYLGLALIGRGEVDAGALELEVASRGLKADEVLAELAYARAVGGDEEGARRVLADLAARRPVVPGVALVHLGLGETDEALSCLERAYDQRLFTLPRRVIDPLMGPLRSDPRFQDLLGRLGLADRS